MGNRIMGLHQIDIIFTVKTDENAQIPVLLRPLLQQMKVTVTPQQNKEIKIQDFTDLVQKTLHALSSKTKHDLFEIKKIQHIKEVYKDKFLNSVHYLVCITVHFFSKQSLDTFFKESVQQPTIKRNQTNNTTEVLQINDLIVNKNYSKSSDILLTLPYEQPKSTSVIDLVTQSLPLIHQTAKAVQKFRKVNQESL
jgi:hypothetical protein